MAWWRWLDEDESACVSSYLALLGEKGTDEVSSSLAWWRRHDEVSACLFTSAALRVLPVIVGQAWSRCSVGYIAQSVVLTWESSRDGNGPGRPIGSLAWPTLSRSMDRMGRPQSRNGSIEPEPIDPMGATESIQNIYIFFLKNSSQYFCIVLVKKTMYPLLSTIFSWKSALLHRVVTKIKLCDHGTYLDGKFDLLLFINS